MEGKGQANKGFAILRPVCKIILVTISVTLSIKMMLKIKNERWENHFFAISCQLTDNVFIRFRSNLILAVVSDSVH